MKIFKLRNLFLVTMALPLVMLAACSSSEEEPTDTSSGGGSCAEQCSAVPDMNQDECMIACEA